MRAYAPHELEAALSVVSVKPNKLEHASARLQRVIFVVDALAPVSVAQGRANYGRTRFAVSWYLRVSDTHLGAQADFTMGTRLPLAAAYHFHRGDYARAVALGEEYIRACPPMTRLGWSATYATTALAYAHLGQPERALAICERALAQVSPEEREYLVLYTSLEAAYATALALVGRPAHSAAVFDALIERLRAMGEVLRVIGTLHYRVRLARIAGDREGLQSALTEMRLSAGASGNPAAVELAQRLADERRVYSDIPDEEAV